MEQATRKLIKELSNNPDIVELENNYYEIKIKWKTGIKEIIVLNKRHTKDILDYFRSKKYRPRFKPKARWWNELSTGNQISPHHRFINELIDNVDHHPNLVEWKWSDYANSKFYERLLLFNDIIKFITENGWAGYDYPESVLNAALNKLYSVDVSKYKSKKSKHYFIINRNRPWRMIIKHFMPYGHYGNYDPYYQFNIKSKPKAKRIYNSINNIIRRNRKNIKKGFYKRYDFNYDNILKFMWIKNKKIKPYKFKQICLFKSLIRNFDLCGRSMYDIEPGLGDMLMAASTEKCPYYFRPSCPFDLHYKEMADYLVANCHEDVDGHYDFTIFDNWFKYDKKLYMTAMEIFKEKVDMAIVFVNNQFIDEFTEIYPPDHTEKMFLFQSELGDGKWLIYYF